MTALILGLLLFIGVHAPRIIAEPARQRFIAQRGEGAWKGLVSLGAAVGLGLIVWGYGQTRLAPVALWLPPTGMRHLAALLTLIAFVLLAAAYVPKNALKARLRHPMVLGIKTWALAHLLSNGNLAEVLLFGSFLIWAVLSFRAARARDRDAAAAGALGSPASTAVGTVMTIAVGIAAWAGFAIWGHAALIGVRPFG